uniref:Metalloendopeptidase n=1 Tax=Steinernema glaseri TaxID=37863 RepID=A0A1I8AVB3_9BILA
MFSWTVLTALLALFGGEALELDTIARNFLSNGNNQTFNGLQFIRDKLNSFRSLEKDLLTYENPKRMSDNTQGDESEIPVDHIDKETPEMSEINKQLKQYLYQGDIALTAGQLSELVSRSKRQAYKDSHFPQTRWQKGNEGAIAYFFDWSIDYRVKGLIREALRYWEERTCLQFEEDGPQRPILRFFKGTGCWSYVGKMSFWKEQDISIGKGCDHFGVIVHEIGHALGFFHAQSRHDRDQYVSFIPENVELGSVGQFNKESTSTNENYGMPYDYGSVMHYSEEAFATDEQRPALVAREKLHQHTMGSRVAPSFVDVLLMNTHYQCLDECKNSQTKCANGGYPSPKNCNKCICPWGFGGRLCTMRALGTIGTSDLECGQTVLASDEWKPLNGKVGNEREEARDRHDSCHWHIKASSGHKVEISVLFVGPVCSGGCFFGNVEFKMKRDFRNTGYRMCCAQHKRDELILTSETELAVTDSRMSKEENKEPVNP